MIRPAERQLSGYGFSFAITVLALALTWIFARLVEPGPYPLLAAAIAASAWYGGIIAGALSAVFATLASDYLFIHNAQSISLGEHDLARFGLFSLVAFSVSWLAAVYSKTEKKHLQLAAIVAASGDAIISSDRNGRIASWNAGAERLFGYKTNEALGRPLSILLPTGKQAELADLLERTRRGERIEQFETVRVRKDGREVHISLTISPIKDKTGKVVGSSAVALDITGRKQAEEALLKLSSAIEQTADNVMITDREGRIEYVNPAFETITGYTSEEALGKTPRLLKSGEHDRAYYEQLWEHILSGQTFRGQFTNRKKNGERYFEERTITPIKDEYGQITHFVSTGKDITERVQAYQNLERRVEQRTRETAELYVQAEQRSRELEALYRADGHLHRHLRLDQVLGALVDVVIDILHADKASVQVWDPQRQRLVVRAARGYSPGMLALMSNYVPGDGIAGNVFLTGEAIAVEDARFANPPADRIAENEGIRSVLSVPIKIGEQVFGVFGMDYCQPRAFSPADKRLFLALAQRAAIAIENARLYEQAQQAAVLEERQRLARELHDSVTQSLYSLMLLSEAGRRLVGSGNTDSAQHYLGRIGETAQQALKEMRLLVYEMRPLALQEVGLVQALRQRLDAVEKRTGIAARLVLEGALKLPEGLEEELYRIAQEALNNSLKHAAATSTIVRLAQRGDTLQMEIVDNGKGFDFAAANEGGGMGLDSMRQRAQRLGGELVLDSLPGRGTSLSIQVKIPQVIEVGNVGPEVSYE